MRKRNKKTNNNLNVFKSENGRNVLTKFKLGDVVRVSNVGEQYATYTNAFKTFNILDKTRNHGIFYSLEYDYDLNCNWIVCGIAIHENSSDIVYHIMNMKKQHMVISEDGLELRDIKYGGSDTLLKKNDTFIIKRIPKSYY